MMDKNPSLSETPGKRPFQNHLIEEKSPYLKQHASQPVDWYPWGKEAFEKAEKENKPVFLSIGYSTCHWCHVMAHESFEDFQTAQLINQTFIPVKVDREERPDIDKIYMHLAMMMTGSGGWPLTLFLTPDKTPFFAATYIPKENRFGRRGLKEIILQVKDLWESKNQQIRQQADRIADTLQKNSLFGEGDVLTREVLDDAFGELRTRFDRRFGGFGQAPKFPSAHQLLFLLRYWKRTGHSQALEMVEKTLLAMRAGGIFDHIGFGFHRYATDAGWILPHFEKMLYDQALLVMAYTEAFQATGKGIYQKTVREICDFVLKEMTSWEGGFYSAVDADSEGQEGKFYLWSQQELEEILDKEELKFIQKHFSITKEGNLPSQVKIEPFLADKNIFYRNHPDHFSAAGADSQSADSQKRESNKKAKEDKGNTIRQAEQIWTQIRKKLYHHRLKRTAPKTDDKILTDWNGLMIAALAQAGRVLAEEKYVAAARKAIDFIFHHLTDRADKLFHRYREGQAGIIGYLDDYAFFIWGLLEAHQTTFADDYLQKAILLSQILIDDFWDQQNGGFYFTSSKAEGLLVRQKEAYDGAIPSGNSAALLNLVRLAHLTGEPSFFSLASRLEKGFSQVIKPNPISYTYFLCGVDFILGPSYEVLICGNPQRDDTQKMFAALHQHYFPRKVVLFQDADKNNRQTQAPIPNMPIDFTAIDGKATCYICRQYSCQLPVTDIKKMLAMLTNLAKPATPATLE